MAPAESYGAKEVAAGLLRVREQESATSFTHTPRPGLPLRAALPTQVTSCPCLPFALLKKHTHSASFWQLCCPHLSVDLLALCQHQQVAAIARSQAPYGIFVTARNGGGSKLLALEASGLGS